MTCGFQSRLVARTLSVGHQSLSASILLSLMLHPGPEQLTPYRTTKGVSSGEELIRMLFLKILFCIIEGNLLNRFSASLL
jgi:hypothetical protein